MTEAEALHMARAYLRTWLDVRPCDDPPQGLYGFNEDSEILFEIVRGGPMAFVGESSYLAVSKETGQVRIAGSTGE